MSTDHMTPWQRLASREPSIFAQDKAFAPAERKVQTALRDYGPGTTNLDKREQAHAAAVGTPNSRAAHILRHRTNSITVTKRSTGEIPQALRSSKGAAA